MPPGDDHLNPELNLTKLLTEQDRDFCNSTEVSSDPGTMNLCYVQLKMKL